MDCAGIQELMSEYIDGTLDAKAVQVVEKHISVCEDCEETLASLRAMIEELNTLEPMKAPADFLEKIHQRMEPRSNFSRFFMKLFVPFKIKIPLQLAAAAFASILVVMVLNLQKSEYQKMQPLETSQSEKFMDNLKSDHLTSQFKTKPTAPAAEDAPARLSDSEPELPARRSRVKMLAKPSVQKESESPAPGFAKIRPSSDSSRPIELFLVLNTEGGMGAVSKAEPDRQAAKMQESEETSGGKETMDKDLSGKYLEIRQNNQVENLLSGIDPILKSLKGQILTKEYHKPSNQLKSIRVQIPAKNYTSFCRELTRFAVFKTQPPALSEENRETVDLLINFTVPE